MTQRLRGTREDMMRIQAMSFARMRTQALRLLARQGKEVRSHRSDRVCISSHGVNSASKSGTLRKLKALGESLPAMGRTSPTLRRAWPQDGPVAAICVQYVDVQCVLQFTLIHAAGCDLHRRTSRVIHRLKLFLFRFCNLG